jgi:segregation and condensation protein A
LADYRVNLDIFAGPLDLLLYLVRKEEVDIYDIPIARITDQYIRYIEMLKTLDIDLAGDFLVMAATLMQIKSAMLLPKAEPELLQEEDLYDPRAELIRQLLEYKKFKDAANLLSAAADEQKQRFARPDSIIDRLSGRTEPEMDIEQISIWDLLDAFDSVCKATGAELDISHITDDTPIDLYQIEILHRLQSEGQMTFERIFEFGTGRLVMVGLFLALLELIRAKLVWAEQPASESSIYLRALTDEPAEQAVQNAILAVAETDRSQEPPIPISELPPESKPSVSLDATQQHTPIPIAELSAQTEPSILQQQQALRTGPDGEDT